MKCWNCQELLTQTERKISFRALCEKCGSALHCCKNCKYYAPGRPNDCAVPGTDYISDRSANNFCEEFSPLDQSPKTYPSQDKKKFDDLFK